ncbi:MAG: pyruvate kinase [Gammaproteobacteria bacterium]
MNGFGEPQRRRTKIVATVGPATDDPTVLAELIRAGADCLRINFSHGNAQDRETRVRRIRDVSAGLGHDVGIMGDLQGPKIRIESFVDGEIELEDGAEFVLDTDMEPGGGNQHAVGVAYKSLHRDVSPGDFLLLDDGLMLLEVREVSGSRIITQVARGGTLKNKKGVNKQGGGLSAPALTDKDREDIRQAAALGLDFVAVSFARNASDIDEARGLLRSAGSHAHVVAKIERAEAVENINEIMTASDVIMVARGDLAVEVGYASMTGLQKGLIRLARSRNKVSITATQMLESMIHSGSPTRAEVSDVANAVMDGSDAIMLSAETAVGSNPVEAVRTMASVAVGAEKHERFSRAANYRIDDVFNHVDEAIAMAAMYTANHLDVKAIVAMTESGSTSLWMSRVRSGIPVFAFTRHESTRRRVTMYRGVYPIDFDVLAAGSSLRMYASVFERLMREGAVSPGDRVIVTRGELEGISGGTNTMQVLTVTEPGSSADGDD